MKVLELEYRGLNLLDEISTVELAINQSNKVVHVFDVNQVVEPEYNFTTKRYQLNDGFYKMAKVLYGKQFIFQRSVENFEEWSAHITWLFYGTKKSIFKFEEHKISEVIKLSEIDDVEMDRFSLYEKYVMKLK